jgi:uncharacterized protein (TIGR00725 family)
MKYQICVSGAADGDTVGQSHQLAYELGKAITSRGKTLLTGATTGLPHFAALGGMSVKTLRGISVGFSPAKSYEEHMQFYKLPIDEFDYVNFTGLGYVGRDVYLVQSSDAIITVGGRMGSLHEFSTAVEAGKICGVLVDSGGLADFIPKIVKDLEIPPLTELIYDSNPDILVEKVISALNKRYEKSRIRHNR